MTTARVAHGFLVIFAAYWTFGDQFSAHANSDVVISGGTFGDYFTANPNSNVNFVGSEFFLDNSPIDLMLGESEKVEVRVGVLSGRFSDGTPFSFDLGGEKNLSDYFATDANLIVTLVPEPTAILTGMLSFCFLFLLIHARRVQRYCE